jgi:hypothetical protein
MFITGTSRQTRTFCDPTGFGPKTSGRSPVNPLIFKGEVLGVLAVFSRGPIQHDQFGWLRTFADHAAVDLANARAFDEVPPPAAD